MGKVCKEALSIKSSCFGLLLLFVFALWVLSLAISAAQVGFLVLFPPKSYVIARYLNNYWPVWNAVWCFLSSPEDGTEWFHSPHELLSIATLRPKCPLDILSGPCQSTSKSNALILLWFDFCGPKMNINFFNEQADLGFSPQKGQNSSNTLLVTPWPFF